MVQTQLKPEELAREKVDEHLKKTGWTLLKEGEKVPEKGNYALPEEEINGLFADYVLYIDGKRWGIIEAKKKGDESLEHALTQAVIRYAKPLDVKYVYAVNTKLDKWNNTIINLIFRDLRVKDSKSREVFTFYTPRGLQLLETYNFEESNNQLLENPVSDGERGLRYYQADAINEIEKAVDEKKQKMIVHMATGTGKTFTVVSSIFRFLSTKPKRFKRILFLVDRRELADQAVRAFATYDAMPGRKFDEIYEVFCDRIPTEEESGVKYNSKQLQLSKISNPKEGDAHVYVTTIQRLYQQITGRSSFKSDEEEDEMEWEEQPIEYNEKIPIDAFDLIISDECHRSIYNLWDIVLSYFDAVQIGLSATPTTRTYDFFDRNLIYQYGYHKAVDDGFLVDYDLIKIGTKSTEEGAVIPKNQRYLLKDRKTGVVDEEYAEEDIKIDTTKLERDLTVPDRLRKVVQEFKKYYKPGQKTLVFAKNDNDKGSHANALVKAFREELNYGNDKVVKITYKSGKDVKKLIKQFRNSPNEAEIVVTVDLLSTGVDIPRIENIIFDRVVKSRVLFEQMMGRGTRLCKEIGKTHYTVFDTMGVCELHRTLGNSVFDVPYNEPSKSLTLKQLVSKIQRGIRKDYYVERLIGRIQRIAKKLPPMGMDEFADYEEIPGGDLRKFASSLKEKLDRDFVKNFQLFKDDVFLDKLDQWSKYDAKKLLIATDYLDKSNSEVFFKSQGGESLRPDEYIHSFVEYIKKNEGKLEAIRLLKEKPQNLELSDLKELAKLLRKQPQLFSIYKLNKALELSSKEELKTHSNKVLDQVSELLSYIKFAEKNEEEFFSLTERVDQVIVKTFPKKDLTIEQIKWLDVIKNFVITRLRITKKDINESIVFRRVGGYANANRIFDNQLEIIIEKLNEVVVK